MKNFLFVVVVLIASAMSSSRLSAQAVSRGDSADHAVLEAAHRSVENQMVVMEMENAGFELDVEEGFDEEWEEDLWVGSEGEDAMPSHVDSTDLAKFDVTAVPAEEEIASGWSEDSWENPEQVLLSHEASEGDIAASEEGNLEEGTMRGEEEIQSESDEEIGYSLEVEEDLLWEDENETAELNWWDEQDEDWSDDIDDMEMDEFDQDLEEGEEDLDFLEEMYYRG